MIPLLALAAVPALLAAALDSTGLAAVAGAGLLWALAAALCTAAPLVQLRSGRSLNEPIAAGLSVVAATMAVIGLGLAGAMLV